MIDWPRGAIGGNEGLVGTASWGASFLEGRGLGLLLGRSWDGLLVWRRRLLLGRSSPETAAWKVVASWQDTVEESLWARWAVLSAGVEGLPRHAVGCVDTVHDVGNEGLC